MLIDELKKEKMYALKDKDDAKKGILGVVIGKYMLLQTDEKYKAQGGPSDTDLIKIISKTIKELEEEKEGYVKVHNVEKENDIIHQIDVISKYLPKMLSDEEIKNIILGLDDKSVPNVMKYFKTNYNGSVDMGKVSSILRSLN